DGTVEEIDPAELLDQAGVRAVQPDRRPGALEVAVLGSVPDRAPDEPHPGAAGRLVLDLDAVALGVFDHAVAEFDQSPRAVAVDAGDPDARAPAAGHATLLEEDRDLPGLRF